MSLFNRRRKTPEPAPPPEQPNITRETLREDVGRLYERGVNPLHAIRAMLHDTDGGVTTDATRLAQIWLGINDLLDRDDITNPLRSELVSVRDAMGKTIGEASDEAKAFVANYRAATRRINEMKLLQAYKPRLIDAAGMMQREAVEKMLAEIEHARDTDPGSLAQDISDEALASLYRLRDNWDDPAKLT